MVKKGPCFVCSSVLSVQGHHLIPRARRGGDKGPTISLCATCHSQAHILSLTRIPLEDIPNERLKKLVKIIRLANIKLPHSKEYRMQLKLPEILHREIKTLAKDHNLSMSKMVISILLNHILEVKKKKTQDD
jgi:hypothetical protein